MLDSGGESAPATPAACPSLRGKRCAGNSGLSHHVRVVRALEWVAVGDAAGRQGLGDAPGGGSPGQGGVCQNPEEILAAHCFIIICNSKH